MVTVELAPTCWGDTARGCVWQWILLIDEGGGDIGVVGWAIGCGDAGEAGRGGDSGEMLAKGIQRGDSDLEIKGDVDGSGGAMGIHGGGRRSGIEGARPRSQRGWHRRIATQEKVDRGYSDLKSRGWEVGQGKGGVPEEEGGGSDSEGFLEAGMRHQLHHRYHRPPCSGPSGATGVGGELALGDLEEGGQVMEVVETQRNRESAMLEGEIDDFGDADHQADALKLGFSWCFA